MMINIHLKYFASLREKLASAGETLLLPEEVKSAEQVRHYLMQRDAVWADALANTKNVRVAYNQKMLTTDTLLEDGDELAFFPPVTGG